MITRTTHLAFRFSLVIVFCLLTSPTTSAQERLCDPSFENCYPGILDLVRNETIGIDMAFYMIELPELADAIIAVIKRVCQSVSRLSHVQMRSFRGTNPCLISSRPLASQCVSKLGEASCM